MARACIFCGSSGKLSGEHIFPDWLSKMFDDQIVGINEVRGDNLARDWVKSIFQDKLKKVCGACNSGWMSTLENDVKNLLLALIFTHDQVTLDDKNQRLLAFWAQKTLLVVNEATVGGFSIPKDFYHELYQQKMPIKNILVNIGWKTTLGGTKEPNDPLMSFEIKQISQVEVKKDEVKRIHGDIEQGKTVWAATLSLGYIVFQFFGHNLSGQLEVGMPQDDIFLTISPDGKVVVWPSTLPIEVVGGLASIRQGMY
jgi:hypothetical protein